MARAALYARYSSDMQSAASIEDQLRLCREDAKKRGHTIVHEFTDAAISGASMGNRPGIKALLAHAADREFDVVIVESIDRLARNAGDTHRLFDKLNYYDVQLITLADGVVSDIHISFKGLSSSHFLKDLAAKVKRGMRGRVEKGLSPSKLSFGYDAAREFSPDGKPQRGLRKINPEQAAIVLRIFKEYDAGLSPFQIARGLNKEGITSATGGSWSAHYILGRVGIGEGVLAHQLYAGLLVYNRRTYRKDPETGKKQARPNPRSEWITVPVPHLRIIPEDLWERVQDRAMSRARPDFHRARAPARLLSGLCECGVCGGPYQIIMRGFFGCRNMRQKGICDNKRMIRIDRLEGRVLAGLRERLVEPHIFAEFEKRYREALKERRAEFNRTIGQRDKELADIKTKIGRFIAAIEGGTDTVEIRTRLTELTARRDTLAAEAADHANDTTVVPFIPDLSAIYKAKVDGLADALKVDQEPVRRAEATGLVRALIERIVLHPGAQRGQMRVDLHGHIPAILEVARDRTTFKSLSVPIPTLESNWPKLVVAV